MKALVMTVAALATAFGTAYGLELLFPHPEQQAAAEAEMPALERILQQPLAPAPIAPGKAIKPASADGTASETTAEATLSEDMSAPASAPIEVAAALQVDPPVVEAAAAEPAEPELVSPTAADTASIAVPAETADDPSNEADRPVLATPAPTAQPPSTTTSAPVTATTAATPAPRPTVPEVSLDAWWADEGAADGLNVVFAGSAAYAPAIVLIISGTVADGAAANRAITVRDINGNMVAGNWSVSPENNTMLVFPVTRGGIYRLVIDGSLGDSRGRTLGRTLGGPVHVR